MLRGTVGNLASMRRSGIAWLCVVIGCRASGPIVEPSIPGPPSGRVRAESSEERERRELAERVAAYVAEHPETTGEHAELLRAGKSWIGQPESMLPVLLPDAEISEHWDFRGRTAIYRTQHVRISVRDGSVSSVSRY